MAKSNFFTDGDSWFNRGLSHLFDVILLGILTTLLCIPVITIGAAVTANMDAMLRLSMKKEGSIFKRYFEVFGKNFVKSTIIWIIYLIVGALIGGAAFITLGGLMAIEPTIRVIMSILSIILIILYGFSISYVFALQSRYENKIFTTILNSILISISNFPRSFVILALTTGLVTLGFFFVGLIPLFVILEFSLVTFVAGKMIVPVLIKLGDKDAAGEVTEEEAETQETADKAGKKE